MKFDPETGILEIENLILRRYANIPDLVKNSRLKWEPWGYQKGPAGRIRTVFDVKSSKKSNEIILIINYDNATGGIWFWDLGPTNLSCSDTWGTKKRLIRVNEEWFERQTKVQLPIKKDWGDACVSFDAHNLTASVLCFYKEYRDNYYNL